MITTSPIELTWRTVTSDHESIVRLVSLTKALGTLEPRRAPAAGGDDDGGGFQFGAA